MAGRPRSIDRDKVLDAAERLVRQRGAAALTIGAVADEANITKGGVQYCFGTRDGLIDAIYERWKGQFDEQVAAIAGPDADPFTEMRAYIEASRQSDNEAEWERASAILSLLMQRPDHIARYREDFQQRFRRLDTSTPDGRSLALAFVAAEGAFFLRGFGLVAFAQAEQQFVFSEIARLAGLPEAEDHPPADSEGRPAPRA